jgi:flagellar basal-body rod protein FlgC
MIAAIQSALSALNAFQKKLGVAAHNVANASTPTFKGSRVEMVETESGVDAVIAPVTAPGPAILQDTIQGPAFIEQSNVDLGNEMVDLILAQRGFQANVRVLEAQDQALGTLLDRRD